MMSHVLYAVLAVAAVVVAPACTLPLAFAWNDCQRCCCGYDPSTGFRTRGRSSSWRSYWSGHPRATRMSCKESNMRSRA